jgi:hypothetical protein
MDIDVLEMLLAKKNRVAWKKDSRRERFVLFSISGFTERLHDLATKRGDLILFSCNPK